MCNIYFNHTLGEKDSAGNDYSYPIMEKEREETILWIFCSITNSREYSAHYCFSFTKINHFIDKE